MLIAAFLTVATPWKQLNACDGWMGEEMRFYYSALQEEDILPFVTTQMNLEDVTLSGTSRPRDSYCMASLLCDAHILTEDEPMETEWAAGCRAEGRGAGRDCFMGTEFWLGKMKSSGDGWQFWLHNHTKVLNTTKLYT